ncbi:probable proteasome inhibitor [Punica granatum]|uniref:Probable proteasome inhibitor n=1 Tax=Punica granatum TaxID=22663 RepID=A0A6P8DLJ0_PUNGR|nr:probable proteasome inhibitor [Punica granatum]
MAPEKTNGVMAVIRATRPSFRNKHDKVAFAVHATFLASGYFLTATGTAACEDGAISSASSEEVGIDRWNEIDDEYAFVYAKPAGSRNTRKVLVKCLAMNDKLVVNALENGSREPVHIEIDVDDFAAEGGGRNYSDQYKDLEKLVENFDKEILSKFDGSSRPLSSAEATSTTAETGRRSTAETGHRSRLIDETGAGAGEPWGPRIHPSGVVLPPVYPDGFSDTVPGPGAGVYPGRGGFGGDGSMLLGPDDPRFFGGGDRQRPFIRGPPQPGVPPGARFDPYGPPDVPDFDPTRFMRNPPRRPGGGGGIHPDLQHFPGGPDFI